MSDVTEELASTRVYDAPSGATAKRPSWAALPSSVRALVEARFGQPVLGAVSQGGGFTNGFASRLRLADGSRAFVKAVSRADSPQVCASYEQEIVVVRALPEKVPAPRLTWSAEVDGWLVLAFGDVEGRMPARPWRPDELAVVLEMLPDLTAALTPAPAGLPPLETTADMDQEFSFWRRLAAGEAELDAVAVPEVWLGRLETLVDLERNWAELAAGETGVHFDLREDNLILTATGQVLVCDWNWMALAAPWIDLVCLLISVHGDGLDADHILAEHPLTRDVPARAINAFLVALAGYFTEAAARPPFPHSPWMRTHQAWWRDSALNWLTRRLI